MEIHHVFKAFRDLRLCSQQTTRGSDPTVHRTAPEPLRDANCAGPWMTVGEFESFQALHHA